MKTKKEKIVKKKTRKQLRKEKRVEKKAKKNEYYMNKNKPGRFVLLPNHLKTTKSVDGSSKDSKPKKNQTNIDEKVNVIKKEKEQQQKLQNQMRKKRKRQLLDANEAEDRNIKKLEKQLKLNKRTSKSVPQSFASDGLDYLLEICDLDKFKDEKTDLDNLNDNFEEDLDLMSSQSNRKNNKIINNEIDDDSNEDEFTGEDEFKEEKDFKTENEFKDAEDAFTDEEDDFKNDEDDDNVNYTSMSEDDSLPNDDIKERSMLEDEHEGNRDVDDYDEDEELTEEEKDDGTWEDIYGRKRSKTGTIIKDDVGKYVPPAVRQKSAQNSKAIEKLNKLKRILKGLLNRLAESNMHSISTQIEELYMNNSRNDMNETLTSLILESIVTHIMAPERLLMENVILITILHANVGNEIGAHFLQTIAKKFDILTNSEQLVEDKTLNNVVNIMAQLYNYKLYNSQLIYEILGKLSTKFDEKSIECILHVLKAVGFNLRKDDPLALKSLILNLQKKASSAAYNKRDNSRVKFLLDVLLAIKNNNMSKIPNYDNTYSEHLKKLLKGFIRKGNYVTALNITLDDLLKAEEKGKWWVVGSSWTGNIMENKVLDKSNEHLKEDSFSQKLLQLAKSQRMNTDVRRNIFCIIMSAEDYMDAFEKLLHLGLKNQQEQEIIHVLLHCCLQEKQFNPFYGVLAQKFCDYDRKFQIAIKYSVWDKLKAINESSTSHISNLAKLLTHLFLEKGLPISTLKIVQFSELDKVTLRFMRQTLLGILLHDDLEACTGVFEKIVQSDKLKMFRDSLKLFVHHFLLKNLKSNAIDDDKRRLLEERAQIINKILTVSDKRTRF